MILFLGSLFLKGVYNFGKEWDGVVKGVEVKMVIVVFWLVYMNECLVWKVILG